jgi:DNA phosphorothioation-dependent restriction protein DptG
VWYTKNPFVKLLNADSRIGLQSINNSNLLSDILAKLFHDLVINKIIVIKTDINQFKEKIVKSNIFSFIWTTTDTGSDPITTSFDPGQTDIFNNYFTNWLSLMVHWNIYDLYNFDRININHLNLWVNLILKFFNSIQQLLRILQEGII